MCAAFGTDYKQRRTAPRGIPPAKAPAQLFGRFFNPRDTEPLPIENAAVSIWLLNIDKII